MPFTVKVISSGSDAFIFMAIVIVFVLVTASLRLISSAEGYICVRNAKFATVQPGASIRTISPHAISFPASLFISVHCSLQANGKIYYLLVVILYFLKES